MKYDALVVGAGPAGTTAALMLARAGWSVAIVEKTIFPRRKVCGEFISATSMPLLHELGISDPFLELAGPEIRRVGLFANETVLDAAMPKAADSLTGWGRGLGREHLDTLLLNAAVRAGARLWQPWRASELRFDSQEYRCKIAAEGSEQDLLARVVVGAYGSWQSGALPVQSVEPHKPSDLLAFKAHWTECELPVGVMPLLVFPGGYGGMVHCDGGRVSLSCCLRRDQLQECRRKYGQPRAAESVLRHIKASCLGARQALRRARPEGAWLSAGPIRPGIRIRSTQDAFLVGNLAGEAHPIVAEGISMAMQSAWLLSRRLIANQDDVVRRRRVREIQKEYASDWNAWFGMRVRLAAVFAHLAMRPGPTNLLLPLVGRFPKILSFGAHLSGKTKQIVPPRSSMLER